VVVAKRREAKAMLEREKKLEDEKKRECSAGGKRRR
jgi:hypothetical protein